MVYTNYGDPNFFDRGRLVDSDHSDTEFRILFCNRYDDLNENGEEHYQFGHATVDITDNWIDKDSVCRVNGQTMDFYNANPIQFALDILDAHDPECFGVNDYSYRYNWRSVTKPEILRELQDYVIDCDSIYIEGYRENRENIA